MAIPELDVNQLMVLAKQEFERSGGVGSPYFEDLWYQLTKEIETMQATIEDHEARITALEP